MKLKFKYRNRETGQFDPEMCCVYKCKRISEYIDETMRFANVRLYFCEECWNKRDEVKEK